MNSEIARFIVAFSQWKNGRRLQLIGIRQRSQLSRRENHDAWNELHGESLPVEVRQAVVQSANAISLVQSAKLCRHDPWAILKDVLTRLPTQLNSRIDELLPNRWQAVQ